MSPRIHTIGIFDAIAVGVPMAETPQGLAHFVQRFGYFRKADSAQPIHAPQSSRWVDIGGGKSGDAVVFAAVKSEQPGFATVLIEVFDVGGGVLEDHLVGQFHHKAVVDIAPHIKRVAVPAYIGHIACAEH